MRSVKHVHKLFLALALAALPIVFFFWSGYLEWYVRVPKADVRVNGLPTGYVHRGKVSSILTRTDGAGPHSYRIWPTSSTHALIFDCYNWHAPDKSRFLQGKISAPCIYPTSGAVTNPSTAPASTGDVKNGILRFTTRDGAVITLRAPFE